jgi:hypothetical protein
LAHLSAVIADAAKALAERGIGDRAGCAAGDFSHRRPAGGDGYLLPLVLHDRPAPEALRILCNIAAASGSGTRLLINELVVPSGDTPHLPEMIDLTMPTMAGGKQRTEPQWRQLLRAAGFASTAVRQTSTPHPVIHAVAPRHSPKYDAITGHSVPLRRCEIATARQLRFGREDVDVWFRPCLRGFGLVRA